MPVKDAMEAVCDVFGYEPTEYLEKVAKAKEKFFSPDEWVRCPCDRDNPERFCISRLCRKDIEENNHCHCNAYRKRGSNDKE